MDDLTREEIKKKAEAARAWMATPEGQKALLEAMEEAGEQSKRFEEAQKIDPKFWHQPMTI